MRPTKSGWLKRVCGAFALVAAAGMTTVALPAVANAGLAGPADTILGSLPAVPPLNSDPWYTPPARLPAGQHGDVIKSRTIVSPLFPQAKVTQFMYLSQNQAGKPVPVTGVLLQPLLGGGANAPLVALTPGTRGLGKQCAPSQFFNLTTLDPRQPEYQLATYQNYITRGISVAITDYVGGGTPLAQEYLVGRSEAHNGLDVGLAAIRLSGNDALTPASPFGFDGYSQGGQAAGWETQIVKSYAPGLNLKGSVLDAPPTDMNAIVEHFNGNPTAGAGISLAALQGVDSTYPELKLGRYLTPFGKQVYSRLNSSCVVEELAGFGTIRITDVFTTDVSQIPAVRARLAESQLGLSKPQAPVYMFNGLADTVVPPAQPKDLYSRWCAFPGTSMDHHLIPAEHLSGNVTGSPNAVAWMADRLAGKPAQTGCTQEQTVN